MKPTAHLSTHSPDKSRSQLATRLQARCAEMEKAIVLRVRTVPSTDTPTLEQSPGLRAAVQAGIDFGITTIARGGAHDLDTPLALLAQARIAARRNIDIDLMIRRYVAGNTVFRDFVVGEAEQISALQIGRLRYLIRAHDAHFDRFLDEVAAEFHSELRRSIRSPKQRRLERVKRLLDGEQIDTSQLGYDMDMVHLGLVASGTDATDAIRGLATALDRRCLIVSPDERTVWAWLGGRHGLNFTELERLASGIRPPLVALAFGEPARGIHGWRLTHRQARAGLPIALHNPETLIRYADVALPASMLQDDLLATSLRELYLKPLEEERDRWIILRDTLRAYFAADRNVSSAAAALGVNRHTVTDRLRVVEECLGRPLRSCAAELDAALGLEALATLAYPEHQF